MRAYLRGSFIQGCGLVSRAFTEFFAAAFEQAAAAAQKSSAMHHASIFYEIGGTVFTKEVNQWFFHKPLFAILSYILRDLT